jgi:hypothetical protein
MSGEFRELFGFLESETELPKTVKYLLFTLALLVVADSLIWGQVLPRLKYRYIVVHHSASRVGDLESIRQLHRQELGHRDAAYHLVLANGSTSVPAGQLQASSRYKHLMYSLASTSLKHNARGIHVCVVGNYEDDPVPENIKGALGNTVKLLQKKFSIPDGNVLLHRDVNATLCPGKSITKQLVLRWAGGSSGAIEPAVKAQQQAVVEACAMGPGSVPRWVLLFLLGGNLGVLALAGLFSRWRG